MAAARRRCGLTQVDAAARLGLSQSAITGYERGHRQPPPDVLAALATLYAVSTDYLLGREAVAPEAPRVAEPAPEPPAERQFTANTMRAMNLALGRPINENLPPEMAEAELIILEFNAWLRRTALKRPEALALVGPRIRTLINEVEEHAASPPEAGATGPAGQRRASND